MGNQYHEYSTAVDDVAVQPMELVFRIEYGVPQHETNGQWLATCSKR